MEDLRSILSSYTLRSNTKGSPSEYFKEKHASTSEIPDLFFDEILIEFKLTRSEIILLMYLYRITWCKPNLYKKHGISPLISHTDLGNKLEMTMPIFHQTLRSLEAYEFIETIRSGQYFVRKYFTKDNDRLYGQDYDNFI